MPLTSPPIKSRPLHLKILRSSAVFAPNPGGQALFLDDYTHRYCALAGGWFAGKTWAGARKLANLHLLNALTRANQPTFVKSAVIAPTYQLAGDFDIPELRKTFDEMGLSHRFVSDPRRFHFELPDLGTVRNPSIILVRTADSPQRITGWSVGAIWGDEAARWKFHDSDPTHDPFLQADGRLRDPKARFLQFMVTFTHEGDLTRIYREFELEDKPDHSLYRAGSIQNPYARQFVQVQRQQLSPDLQSQYLDGKAIGIGGRAMYSAFDPARNVDPSLVLDPRLPLQIGIDFNIDPGMHCTVGQYFPHDDLLTTVHEIHAQRMDVRQMAAALHHLVRKLGGWQWPPPLQVYGDASGGSKWSGTGESCFDVLCVALAEANIPHVLRIEPHNPPVVDRVNAVNCVLLGLDGKVRYRIHPRCRELIEDLRRMKWSPHGDAEKSDRNRSHASDADGYRIHYLLPIRRPTTPTYHPSAVL